MTDCEIFGLNPTGHLVMNLLFHMAGTLLLFWALRRMTGALWLSAFVAAVFSLHPLSVESVAWASERKDVLSTFFFFWAILTYSHYVKQGQKSAYALTLVSFALGLMAKPMIVTLPFILLLLDYWPLGRLSFSPSTVTTGGPADSGLQPASTRRLVLEKIPLFFLAVLFSVVTFFAQKHGGRFMATLDSRPLTERVANALVSYISYMRKMAWPKMA